MNNTLSLARVKNITEDRVDAHICPFVYRASPQNPRNAREMGYLIPGQPTHLQEMQPNEFPVSNTSTIYNNTCLRYDAKLNDFLWIGWNKSINDIVSIPIKYNDGSTIPYTDGTTVTCVTTNTNCWIALPK